MHSRTAVLFTGLLLLAGQASAQGVAWRTDLAAAQQEAAQSGRLVLLHFWSTTCAPCVALDKGVFNQPTVGQSIEQMFVPVKLSEEATRQIADTYGVTRIPTDVIMTPKGEVVHKLVSPATPMEYISAMSQVASGYATRAGSAYNNAVASAAAMSGGAVAGGAQVLNNAYAGLGLPPSVPAPTSNGPLAGLNSPPTGLVGDRYAMPSQPALAQQSAAGQVTNPYLAQNPMPNAPAAQGQVAERPTPEAGAPVLPAGAPPLGFDGYCTVSMKRDFRWVKGDAQWGAIHRGRTYLFASQVERDLFLQSPDDFCPVLSGADPVVAVEQSESVPGKREFAVQYPANDGQIYMFSSAENLRKFSSNAAGYAEGVRQAMSNPSGRVVR